MQDAFGVDRGEISKARFGPMRPGKEAEMLVQRATIGLKGKGTVSGARSKYATDTFRATRGRKARAKNALNSRLGKPSNPFDQI